MEPEVRLKKKPGRPKKKLEAPPIDIRGIQREPLDDEDMIEFVYHNPSLFGKILKLFKKYSVSQIELKFELEGLRMVCKDHINKSKIEVFIDGSKMNLYYCREPIRICIERDRLDKVLGILNVNHNKITILSKKDDYRSVLYIVVRDAEYESTEESRIDVIYKPEENDDAGIKDNDTDYPIKFSLSSKHFKNRVSHIKKQGKIMMIEKNGNDPLRITSEIDHKINDAGVYQNSEKIGLRSTVAADDIFITSVFVDYIKPFSDTTIGDMVHISAHKTEKLSMLTHVDSCDNNTWACTIKIFTEIKSHRPAGEI